MLSIIIPTYNEEKYIGDTLVRLKKLTIPNEIIVTDDKSTDKTVEIARQYTQNILVPKSKHISIAANRNDGAKYSHGEYFVFIDSSCYVENPDIFFNKALEHFNDKNLLGLTGKLKINPESETRIDRSMYFIFNSIHLIKNNILGIGESSGKFQMVRRSAFEKIGGYNEKLITREDADLFARLSKIGKTKYVNSLVVFHSGRRAHALGWDKLIYIWMINSFWMAVFKKSKTKNWERWWEKPLEIIKK